MRAQIQEQIDALNKLADLLHHKCENLIAAEAEGIADKLEAAIRPQWVPVAERLPDSFKIAWFVTAGWPVPLCGFYHAGEWSAYGMGVIEGITHWHEIDYPEPPAN